MAFEKIKKQFLVRKYQKELKLIPETRTPNFKEIHSVAILTSNQLYDEIDLVEQVKNSIDSVRNVQIYSFRNFKKLDKKTYKHFTEKDFNIKGKVLDTSLDTFLENQFDLLIGYFDTKNLYLEYTALLSKATFKVGFANVSDKIYDLVVSEKPQNIESFMSVTKKYLKILHKI